MDDELRARLKQLEAHYDVRLVPRPRLTGIPADLLKALDIEWWGEAVVLGERAPLLVVEGEMGTGKTLILEMLMMLPVHSKLVNNLRREDLASKPPALLLIDGWPMKQKILDEAVERCAAVAIAANSGDDGRHVSPRVIVNARKMPRQLWERWLETRHGLLASRSFLT